MQSQRPCYSPSTQKKLLLKTETPHTTTCNYILAIFLASGNLTILPYYFPRDPVAPIISSLSDLSHTRTNHMTPTVTRVTLATNKKPKTTTARKVDDDGNTNSQRHLAAAKGLYGAGRRACLVCRGRSIIISSGQVRRTAS